MKKEKKKVFILVFLALCSLIIALFFIEGYFSYRNWVVDEVMSKLRNITREAAHSINRHLQAAVTVTADISAGKPAKTDIQERMQERLGNNPHFFSGTVTFRPYGFDPDRRLYSCHYVKAGKEPGFIQLQWDYDYTEPEYEWYGKAMEKGSFWSEPYYDSERSQYFITYSSSFFTAVPGGVPEETSVPQGVVAVEITLAGLKPILDNLDLGANGFCSLISRKGLYLHHPDKSLVVGKKTILDTAAMRSWPDLYSLGDRLARCEGGISDHISAAGKESWLAYESVSLTCWSVLSTFFKEDLVFDKNIMRMQLTGFIIAVLVFLLFFLLSLSLIYRGVKLTRATGRG